MTPDENLKSPAVIAALIDHTLLKPEAAAQDVARLCEEARQFHFASVCINPYWVRFAAEALAGSTVPVCTVHRISARSKRTAHKAGGSRACDCRGSERARYGTEHRRAPLAGFSSCKQRNRRSLRLSFTSSGAILKVILETCLLTDEEKIAACRLAAEAGADFVKTSTGFSIGGASVNDVKLMRHTVGETVGVKASGGIRTLDALRQMVAAGANRIGTSSGVNILRELQSPGTAEPAISAGRY